MITFRRKLALALLMAMASAIAQVPDDAQVRSVPLYLEISVTSLPGKPYLEPGGKVKAHQGLPLTINGFTSRELAGRTARITITPPQERLPPEGPEADSPCASDEPAELKGIGRTIPLPPKTVQAKVANDGTFGVQYTPETLGDHEVVAVVGEQRGDGEFEVVEGSPAPDCEPVDKEAVKKEADQLVKHVCKLAPLLLKRAEELPPSPAKNEFLKKLREFEQAVKEGSPCEVTPEWVAGIDSISHLQRRVPATRPAVAPLVRRINEWVGTARQANAQAPKAMAALESGNILCDQIDIVINGLKFCDFFLGLAVAPGKWMKDWAAENVPTKLLGMMPAVKQRPVHKEAIELGWKGILNFHEPMKAQGWDHEFGKRNAAHKMAYPLLAFVGARIFEAYCQTFQGPVTGAMRAEFKVDGKIWWHYNITISGDLTLRYPKNAQGAVIPLTGEIMGNPRKFTSWDNAIPVLFPKLAQGTVFKQVMRWEPLAMNDFRGQLDPMLKGTKVGAGELPDFNPLSSAIDQGGAITRFYTTPGFFRIPVRGELRGDTLRLELREATTDFEGVSTKVYKLMVPVLVNGWPRFTSYALPYKGARFLLFRAMHDGPIEFDVKYSGKVMTIERTLKRERDREDARGLYEATIKACNPGCL